MKQQRTGSGVNLVAALGLALGTMLAPWLQTAQGVLMTYQFSGHIESVEDPNNDWAGLVAPGDGFSGSYTYDPTVSDSWPDDPKYGKYTSPASVFSLTVGNWNAETSGSHCGIGVYNDPGRNSMFDIMAIGFESMGMSISEMVVNLSRYDGSVFDNDALPTAAPLLDLFPHHSLSFQTVNYARINGTLESLVLIPEPGSSLLCLLAGGFAAGRSRSTRGRRF